MTRFLMGMFCGLVLSGVGSRHPPPLTRPHGWRSLSADDEVLTALIPPDSYLSDSSAKLAKQFGRFLVATRLERLERNGTLH